MEAVVRPAKAADRRPLMRFIRHVWGGHDYIPNVWDTWLRDEHGRMFVVEVGGLPVGMNRVRFMRDGSAWFEGARVHPDFRGEGLATKLGENSINVAKQRGIRLFRLTSGSRNRAAHRQIARMEFKEVSRVSMYTPKGARFRLQSGVAKATARDVPRVMELVTSSDEFRLGSGVYWSAFAAEGLTRPVVDSLVREGTVYTAGGSVAVAKVVRVGDWSWKEVCFLGGEAEGALRLVRHVLVGVTGTRLGWRLVYIPQGSRLIRVLREGGFVRDSSLVLFERMSANG